MMKRKRIVAAALVMTLSVMPGCGGGKEVKANEVDDMTAYTHEENLQYMTETYDLTREELDGVDIDRFIEDYGLREEDYSSDEIREILAEEGDLYIDAGSTALYSLLREEEGGAADPEQEIRRIGFFYNEGTLNQRIIIDLEKEVYYLNDTHENPLSDVKAVELRKLIATYHLDEWKNHYEGEEGFSTGSLVWKLVLVMENGQKAVFGGRTGDMTHLPENFGEFSYCVRKFD